MKIFQIWIGQKGPDPTGSAPLVRYLSILGYSHEGEGIWVRYAVRHKLSIRKVYCHVPIDQENVYRGDESKVTGFKCGQKC